MRPAFCTATRNLVAAPRIISSVRSSGRSIPGMESEPRYSRAAFENASIAPASAAMPVKSATSPDGSGAPDGSGEEGPLEVLRARILIEGEIAAEAARDMKPKDIAALEEILLAIGEAADQSVRLAGDRQF